MQRFLRARHWQLFILQVGIPILLQIIMMVTIFATLIQHDPYSNRPPDGLFTTMSVFLPVIMIVALGSLFGWQWSVGMGLQKKLPEHVKMRVGMFRAFMIIPLFYFVLVIALMIYAFNMVSAAPNEPPAPGPFFFVAIAIFIPLHLFSIFCLFYNMIFVAKTIKSVELQREATFSDYALEFVFTWFLFIGIWFLQPRINKIVESDPASF